MRSVLSRPRAGLLATAVSANLLLASVGVTGASSAEPHVDNPFVGATAYVNPDYADLVAGSIERTSDPSLREEMAEVATYPTAVWLDRIAAIGGGEANAGRRSLRDHLTSAVAQRQGNTPITVTIVVYDLPGRDCAALASNGELPLTEAGLDRYRTEYIDPIADIVADPAFADLRIVTVIEPDGLPNLVTNTDDPECAAAASSGIYVAGVQYALERLGAVDNVYTYLDIAHSGWLGWDNNRSGVVQLYTSMAQGVAGGFDAIDGFVTNTANYTPLTEPYLPDPAANVDGQPVRSAAFYEWNPHFDELDFTTALHRDFVDAGWPSDVGFLIDTSRNGWGGADRPSGPAPATDLNAFVNGSKVDRRAHRGLWCNVSGAGIGAPPQATPVASAPHVDALVWVKPPGESDGASESIPNDEGKGADPMCDPAFGTEYGVPTGALPDAPIAGHWFHDQFAMLVANGLDSVTTPPTTTPPTTTPPTTTPPTTTPPTTTPPTTTPPTTPRRVCRDEFVTESSWDSGGVERVTIANLGDSVDDWTYVFDLPPGQEVVNLWNGSFTQSGRRVTVRAAEWNRSLPTGTTATFGFQFDHTGDAGAASGGQLNGAACK